jgi:hypothetical protein
MAAPACQPRVMAFYYGWYGGPPQWRHWRNDDPNFPHDPNHIVATGPQYPGGAKRDITATDYPALGPYDSHSSAVVDQHLASAERSGIDVLISSWWGPGTYEDQSLKLLLDRIEATKSPVRASIYVESWALFYGGQLQPGFFMDPRNFDPSSRAQIRQKAADWISYLIQSYGNRPGLLHTTKSARRAPVIFVYFAGLFIPQEWQDIFSRVQAATPGPVYYQGDIEGADLTQLVQVFDGVHVYTPAPYTVQGDTSLLVRILNPSGSAPNPVPGPTDSATIGTDYKAWSTEAHTLGKTWAATVIPGFDDHTVRNPSFVDSRDHNGERTYDFYWRESLMSNPDWVLITSFNEWHEGTEIEPSVEYGDEFLTRTTTWTNRFPGCVSGSPRQSSRLRELARSQGIPGTTPDSGMAPGLLALGLLLALGAGAHRRAAR